MKNETINEKDVKKEKENLKSMMKINTIIICILVVLLIVSVIAVLVSINASGVTTENNISNMGLVAYGDDYVFYYKSQVGIVKIKDGKEYEISDDQAYSLSYSDEYLYYTVPNSTGGITIKKISQNGDETYVIKDTASSSLKMYLVDGYLYYSTLSDDTISRIDTNGENEEIIISKRITDFNVVDQIIYFTDEYNFLCKIDVNGENYSQLFDETVCSKFQVYDGYIYYYDGDASLIKINLETLETSIVSDGINSDVFNVTNKGIFYLDEENLKIYNLSLDGKKCEEVTDVNTTNTWINIVDEEIYYLQAESNSSYKTCRIKINGKDAEEIIY